MKITLQTLLNKRYQVSSYLSQGGFGYTYLAIDNLFNEKVCVKELYISGRSTRGAGQEVVSENSKDFSFENFADRFWDEARQLASFNHPNIVKVKDFFKANGTIYMVMEFIEGETLQARKIKGGLEDEKSLHHVMSQLLDAVEEVHRHGILHRDIKPENILITKEDKVILIDFGSARDFEDGKTVAHTTLLTPGYAPIEQYSNRAKRGTYTDIYALGATMYFLLTGEKPLAATDRHLESLVPPHKINSSVSSHLSSAVMLAMEMKPEERFQNVGDLRKALRQIKSIQNQQEVILKPKNENVDSTKVNFTIVKKNYTALSLTLIGAVALILIFLITYFGNKQILTEPEMLQIPDKGYKIGKYEVTQEQWELVMGYNPSQFKGCPKCPVDNVSWNDVQDFIRKLNSRTGKNYRLPTQSEWQYAAKANNDYKYSGSDEIDEVAWHYFNSYKSTHNVGEKRPNSWGLYDMTGNVWEWCSDVDGNSRILCGGAWGFKPDSSHIKFLIKRPANQRDNDYGFRLVL